MPDTYSWRYIWILFNKIKVTNIKGLKIKSKTVFRTVLNEAVSKASVNKLQNNQGKWRASCNIEYILNAKYFGVYLAALHWVLCRPRSTICPKF